MWVSCVLRPDEIPVPSPDLVLFPEYIEAAKLRLAARQYPRSMIIGAVESKGRSQAVLIYEGRNRIEYLKVESDGRTKGSQDFRQRPIFETVDFVVGILICRDFENFDFCRQVCAELKTRPQKLKILCVPAEMHGAWFQGKSVNTDAVSGIYMMLCNNNVKYPDYRCRSFITDLNREKAVEQEKCEPIQKEL